AAGNGGVWSSVEELALYEQALSKGVFLKPATIAESRTIKTFSNWSSAKPPEIGWSWFIRETPDHVRLVGHTGAQGGFLCNYITIPDKQIAFFVLTNSNRSDDVFGA